MNAKEVVARRTVLPWIVAGAAVLLAVAGFVLGLFNQRYVSLFEVIIGLAAALAYALPGALIVTRARQGALIGWLFLLAVAIIGVNGFASQYALHGVHPLRKPLPGAVWAAWIQSWLQLNIFMVVGLFLFVYPDGRLPSPRWRAVAALFVAVFGGATLVAIVDRAPLVYYPMFGYSDVPLAPGNPLGVAAFPRLMQFLSDTLWFVSILLFLASLAAPVFRYRRAGDVARRQLRWLMLIALLIVLLILFSMAAGAGLLAGDSDISSLMIPLLLVGFPLAVSFAILRHNLYDLDLIINRALVYGAVTLALALVYFASVVLLQALSAAVIGGEQSPIVIVLSTLLIAALFSPLRQRVQAFIDRRFYRQKYDAVQMLAQFGEVARDSVEIEALRAEVVRVVMYTVQPQTVSVWLREA